MWLALGKKEPLVPGHGGVSAAAWAAVALGNYEEAEHRSTVRHPGAGVKKTETAVPHAGTNGGCRDSERPPERGTSSPAHDAASAERSHAHAGRRGRGMRSRRVRRGTDVAAEAVGGHRRGRIAGAVPSVQGRGGPAATPPTGMTTAGRSTRTPERHDDRTTRRTPAAVGMTTAGHPRESPVTMPIGERTGATHRARVSR